MEIVLIGAGNLATNLGKALFQSGHVIKQVYSHTEDSASALGSKLNSPYTADLTQVEKKADLFIIAVKDSVLPSVASALKEGREQQFFVHTAGSISMDVLPFERRGVLYPMQTFTKERKVDFSVIPFFIETSGKSDYGILHRLSLTMSDTVYELNTADRQYLHLAAVFCNNFANHCYNMGAQLLKQHGDIPFAVMMPLIEEKVAKLYQFTPAEAQTGPAVRWDTNVMDRQMDLLSGQNDMKNIYQMMSQGIRDYQNKKE